MRLGKATGRAYFPDVPFIYSYKLYVTMMDNFYCIRKRETKVSALLEEGGERGGKLRLDGSDRQWAVGS